MVSFLRLGCLAALAISVATACNAQVATVLANDADAAAPGPATGSPTASATASGGSSVDAGPAPPFDPAFCSGTKARMAINGDEVAILDVRGKAIAMNCCDAGKLTIATDRFQALFTVFWRFMASGAMTKPVDVASLPQGSGLELDLGCDPTMTSCANASAEDRFDAGFQGTIDYKPTTTGADTSYCLSVTEPAGSPHVVLHNVRIYVPDLASTY